MRADWEAVYRERYSEKGVLYDEELRRRIKAGDDVIADLQGNKTIQAIRDGAQAIYDNCVQKIAFADPTDVSEIARLQVMLQGLLNIPQLIHDCIKASDEAEVALEQRMKEPASDE